MQTQPSFEVRPYRHEDETRLLPFLEGSLGPGSTGGRTPAFWQWKHLSNPFGPSYTYLACRPHDEIVGLRAFMQWQFEMDGQTVRAVRAVDTATHPTYRRQGVFTSLTRHALQCVREDGVHLVFNTPNRYSLPGYLKMGWQYVGTLRPMVKVLNWPRFFLGLLMARFGRPVRRIGTEGRDAPEGGLDVATFLGKSDVERLLIADREMVGPQVLCTRRSRRYLDWRYAKHPGFKYKVIPCERAGQLEGAVFFRDNTRFGLNEVMLDELFLTSPNEKLARQLVRDLVDSVTGDYIIALFPDGSVKRDLLRKCGFVPIPRYGMNFTVRQLNSIPGIDPYLPSNWGLSLGDLEFF